MDPIDHHHDDTTANTSVTTSTTARTFPMKQRSTNVTTTRVSESLVVDDDVVVSLNSLFKVRTITCFVQLQYNDFVQEHQPHFKNDTTTTSTTSSTATTTATTTTATTTTNKMTMMEYKIRQVSIFLHDAKETLMKQQQPYGYDVQTIRIATNPFGEWLFLQEEEEITESYGPQQQQRLQQLHDVLTRYNIDFCSVGPATTVQQVQQCTLPILTISNKFSTSAYLPSLSVNTTPTNASATNHPVEMAQACAQIIQQIAHETENGYGNFRFCVAASTVDYYIPFFPIAVAPSLYNKNCIINHHNVLSDISATTTTSTTTPSTTTKYTYQFAIGLENGRLLNYLLQQCHGSIQNIPKIVKRGMINALQPLQQICQQISKNSTSSSSSSCSINNNNNNTSTTSSVFEFVGIDTSCNPSLDVDGSIAGAMEQIYTVIQSFGGPGTVAVAATITQTIQSLSPHIQHCGYSGIMLPVCEDVRLAQMTTYYKQQQQQQQQNHSNSDSTTTTDTQTQKQQQQQHPLRISDLLSISQVCGVGIDTVPIPGDCSISELTSILLDMAGLAYRYNKPLSCRVFPVPNKKVGDTTTFQSPYLINSCIVPLSS